MASSGAEVKIVASVKGVWARTHLPEFDGYCSCGRRWVQSMTCHPCRFPGHRPEECVDGPEPPGGYRAGRWCSCRHKSGKVLAQPRQLDERMWEVSPHRYESQVVGAGGALVQVTTTWRAPGGDGLPGGWEIELWDGPAPAEGEPVRPVLGHLAAMFDEAREFHRRMVAVFGHQEFADVGEAMWAYLYEPERVALLLAA